MFGRKKCSLCGGKLDHNICTLCGLDNSKSDANYKLNVSSCDGEPMTHVHEEPSTPVRKKKKKRNPVKKTDEGIAKKMVGIVVSGIVILNVLLPIAIDVMDYFSDKTDDWQISSMDREDEGVGGINEIDETMYQFATWELSDTGSNFSENISPGTYIVGVHIPEGTYEIHCVGEHTTFTLNDSTNAIFISESFNQPEDEIRNVRCYEGAEIKVYGMDALHFESNNAQTESMVWFENPLTDAVDLEDGFIAGEDFPEGVYDIFVPGEQEINTTLSYSVPIVFEKEEGETFHTRSIWVDTFKGDFFHKNLYFPKGTKIELEGDQMLRVQPSERIPESVEGNYNL